MQKTFARYLGVSLAFVGKATAGLELTRPVRLLASAKLELSSQRVQTLSAFLPILSIRRLAGCMAQRDCCRDREHAVGDRPDRYEPRLCKRRPKKDKYFRERRANYKRGPWHALVASSQAVSAPANAIAHRVLYGITHTAVTWAKASEHLAEASRQLAS